MFSPCAIKNFTEVLHFSSEKIGFRNTVMGDIIQKTFVRHENTHSNNLWLQIFLCFISDMT